jgi:hypothetical protein
MLGENLERQRREINLGLIAEATMNFTALRLTRKFAGLFSWGVPQAFPLRAFGA